MILMAAQRTGARKPMGHPALARMLTTPQWQTDIAGLCALFRITRISIICDRPPDLEGGLRLPAAIRGALGRQLHQLARERYNAGEKDSQAWHALFADHDWPGRHVHFPKPFVIWVTEQGNAILVEISLFGEAGRWRDDIVEAFARVMLPREKGGEGGVSLGLEARTRRIWPIRDIFWRVREGIVPPPAKKTFLLSTITPIITGSDETMKGSFAVLFGALLQRLDGLARWHRLDVPELRDQTRLIRLTRHIRVEPVIGPSAQTLPRRSRTFGNGLRKEKGIMGHFLVRDYPKDLWPCLVLGVYVHIGHATVQGAGRYCIGDP